MSIRLRDHFMRQLPQLRHEPIEKRIRATLGGETVVDSTRALLVWEPRRVVPAYAVPEEDVDAETVPGAVAGAPMEFVQLGDLPVLDPSIPFDVRSTEGEALTVRSDGHEAAAFRAADPDLDGYLILDFAGFDAWFEEDERNLSHPRDPFHRIDIVHSSREVRVELDGAVLAESSSPYLLFEPPLPVRYYLPPEDVRTELLQPSDTSSCCAYKGQASYLSYGGERDVGWLYLEPLREAAEVTDRIAFFNERVNLVVDGQPLARPLTPWSPRRD